jgi:AcrR family transcriptional regulator
MPPAKIPSRERGKLRVAALLDAAESVIAEKGYDPATMTEIAARAGASIGSLYQYFPTKTAIADALRARLWDALHAELSALSSSAAGATATQLARNFIATLRGFYRRRPALQSIAEARRLPLTVAADVRNRMRKDVADVVLAYAPGIAPERAEAAAAVIYQLMKAAAALGDEPRLRHRQAALADMETIVVAYLVRVLPENRSAERNPQTAEV